MQVLFFLGGVWLFYWLWPFLVLPLMVLVPIAGFISLFRRPTTPDQHTFKAGFIFALFFMPMIIAPYFVLGDREMNAFMHGDGLFNFSFYLIVLVLALGVLSYKLAGKVPNETRP